MPVLPVVVVPVGADDVALDACLAALDASTPPRTRVWLADDARSGPRGQAVIEHWRARTVLQASHTRRARPLGDVAHLDDVLTACGDLDVAVLAPDARPAPGWLERLAACLAQDGAIASATTWCNAGETAAWPRVGEVNPAPDDPERLARACARMPALYPELPAAVAHAVVLRGTARVRAGGLDAATYAGVGAALVDLSLRLSGLGWRNVLCDTAFVVRDGETSAAEGDEARLAVRWPGWHARLAPMLMRDPLHGLRAQLAEALHATGPRAPQGDLFAPDAPPSPA